MSMIPKRLATKFGALVATLVALVSLWLLAWAVAGMLGPERDTASHSSPGDPVRTAGVAIAPRGEALTFARFERDGKTRLMLVDRYADGMVRGVDIVGVWPDGETDPISLFNARGYETLEALAGEEVAVPAEQLLLPFDGTGAQVAIGINYPEHGKEAAVGDSFVFPKLTTASRHPATLAAGQGELLDYELELGFVALQPIARAASPRYMGLVLASDFTDRATLLRRIDLRKVSSGEGFTEAKSREGFMPVGNLFVIPKDLHAYYRSLTLRLWLNGDLRQVAEPVKMSWDIHRMIAETFARDDRIWQYRGRPAALPIADGMIPARTIFLSGTPDGVIFRPPTLRQMFMGVSELVFTLEWNRPNGIVEPFIREELAAARYLEAGDEVVMHADGLGVLVTRITAAQP
jgi:2-keto-4-pentenoate hydratase/2-oxohepta-3-ene-1,7-dioic acid hydratase in catechol pathway